MPRSTFESFISEINRRIEKMNDEALGSAVAVDLANQARGLELYLKNRKTEW